MRLTELFDRVVQYRNKLLGHGAAGALKDDVHREMAGALLAGASEVLARLDVLAGRRLLHVAEVKQVGGVWLVQRYELVGEARRRLVALELPRSEAARLPDGDRVYLQAADAADATEMAALHPLLLYDAEAGSALFLNSRKGKSRTEYLCYTTGGVVERPDLGGERRDLLARALGMPVAEEQEQAWAAHALQEEQQNAPAESPESMGPRRIGEFELLSELGRGGMGIVYRAWQPSLGRQVALKTLLQVGDVRSDGRFRREIRALGKVDHPHLVKVHTSGSDGEHWFYAMELVEGVPLADVSAHLDRLPAGTTDVDLPVWRQAVSTACEQARQAEKPLSDPRPQAVPLPAREQQESVSGKSALVSLDYVRQVVELVRQTALAAHALHEAGVLHRDIKPGNIMVTADGSRATLMDLGLAQLADDLEGRLTRTRQFVGTLRYVSLEQLGGATLDSRADVYSLGATLWELLALRPLFGVTEQTPTPDLILKLQRDEPERLRRYAPAVGRDLEAVVHCCLEKDPKQRYASAAELANDLERWQKGEPVTARQVTGLERAWKWVKRRPVLAAMAAAVVLALLGGTAVSTWFGIQANNRANQLEWEQKHRALAQVQALRDAGSGAVPAILEDLRESRDEVLPRLRELYTQEAKEGKRMRLALALLEVEPERRDELVAWMLKVENPDEMLLVREALLPHAADLKADLWNKAEEQKHTPAQRFRALVALAAFDSQSPRWKARAEVVDELLSANPLYLGAWMKALHPVRESLLLPLGEVFRGKRLGEYRLVAATVLADYARDRPATLAELVVDADDKQLAALLPALRSQRDSVLPLLTREAARKAEPDTMSETARETLARRQSGAALTLARLEQMAPLWPLLAHSPYPEARTRLIHRLGPAGVDATALVNRLETEKDVSTRRALILALGEYTAEQAPAPLRERLIPKLLGWYRDDPDAGVHGRH